MKHLFAIFLAGFFIMTVPMAQAQSSSETHSIGYSNCDGEKSRTHCDACAISDCCR